MNDSTAHAQVRDLLATAEAFHAWVLDYSITHGRLRLAIHHGDYPRAEVVVCGGCTYFSGLLQGGPYRLELVEERLDDGTRIALVGNGGDLLILCREVTVAPAS